MTPTPWTIEIVDEGQLGTEEYVVWGADREMLLCDTPYYPAAPLRPDAEFIVRAVNSHDDLLAALRNIAEGNLGDAPWQADYEAIRAVARAAISKAEGEHQ